MEIAVFKQLVYSCIEYCEWERDRELFDKELDGVTFSLSFENKPESVIRLKLIGTDQEQKSVELHEIWSYKNETDILKAKFITEEMFDYVLESIETLKDQVINQESIAKEKAMDDKYEYNENN